MSNKNTQNDSAIDGYKLIKKVGKGGMASVYLAIQECFDRRVALKIMHPNSQDQTYGERFLHEAKIVAKLSHNNIVAVYDVGTSGKYHYMSMEYLPGGDLSQKIKDGLTQDEIITITCEIAQALGFSHEKNYVHRDVKPDNILFKENGTAVLTDFGIAKAKSGAPKMTQAGQVLGTPEYMSPEQIRGEPLNIQSDLYALGILLYEMLTGDVPFKGDDPFAIGIQHLKEPVPPLPENLADFQPLINRLLTKNPEKRLADAQTIVDILTNIKNSEAFNPDETPAVVTAEETGSSSSIMASIIDDDGNIQVPTSSQTTENLAAIKTGPSAIYHLVLISLFIITLGSGVMALVINAPNMMPNNQTLMAAHQKWRGWTDPDYQKIQALQDNAKDAIAKQHYVTPTDGSAVSFLNQILSLDADNNFAQENLNEIIDVFLTKAEAAIEQEQADVAQIALEQATDISTDKEREDFASIQTRIDALLAKLAEQAKQEEAERLAALAAEEAAKKQAEEEKAKRLAAQKKLSVAKKPKTSVKQAPSNKLLALRVTALMNQAETYMLRGDYHKPADSNALTKYLEVLSLEPNNKEAKTGIDKIVSKLVPEIEQQIKSGEKSKARSVFALLNYAAPNNTQLRRIAQQQGW